MSVPIPESMTRSELEVYQAERLRGLVKELVGRNPFWTQKLQAAGLSPRDLQHPSDLCKLPFTTKQELVEDQHRLPPYGSNLTYPLPAYSRLHQTSGTKGRPMRWLDTIASWDWFMTCWRHIYRLVGVTREDVVGFPFSFGPFIGFWAAFDGAQRLGNRSLPLGGLSSEARLQFLVEHQATVVCCTPTYALRLSEIAKSEGIDLKNSAVKKLIVAGEPGGNIPSLRERLQAAWGAQVFDHWGMTDIGSLGIETLAAPGGLSLLETECIAEIVDHNSGNPVASGEVGELVITNLGRWGQPVLRYRTGDLVRAKSSPDRTSQLLWLEGGVLGRVDDMFTIRGNNVFPSSVEAILQEYQEIAEFRMVLHTRREMGHLKIELEPIPDVAASADAVADLVRRVSQSIQDRLFFQAEIQSCPVGQLPRSELKSRRFTKAAAE